MSRLLLLAGLLIVAVPSAEAYEGEVRREEIDGGVHQPVLTKPPELLEFVQAAYPPDAEAKGLEGSVKLLVTLDAAGGVVDVQVTQSAGHGFDEAASEAVRKFRFSPAEVDGVPASIALEYVYHFTLQPRGADAGTPADPDGGVSDAPVAEAPATLSGRIVARGSRHRVAAATVRCGDDPEAPEALTDEEGRFSLVVPPGSCDVKVVASGFELFETQEALTPGGTLEVIYHVVPKAIGFETIVRGAREKKEVVRRTLERQELQRIPGTFGDPVRVVQNLPGVARAPFISGQLIVRGASPDQTSTLFDGVEIPLLYHLGGGPSVVNAEFLDRVDFYPGGFGARYGRAIGGVVDVATRKGATDTWHGSLKVDLLDTGLFLEAPVGEGMSVAVAARRSYVDALLPLVLPDDPEGGTLLVLPRYWDYQVRFDLGRKRGEERPNGPSNSYYVMAFGSDDVLKVVASGGARNRDVQLDVHTLFHRVKGDWTWRYGKMMSVFTPYVGYDLAAVRFGELELNVDRYSVGGREDFSIEWSPHVTTRVGFDLLFEHLVGTAEVPVFGGWQYVPFPGAEPAAEFQSFERYINSFDGAVYAEVDLTAGMLTVTPGVRASRSRLNARNRGAVEPRLWVRVEPTEGLAFKGSAGLYTQPPDAFDMEPPPFGTPWLVHEKAFQGSVGVEQQLTDAITVDITGYYNRRYDLVVSPGPVDPLPDGTFDDFPYVNDGVGRAYGLELMLRHGVTRNFFGWIAYTLNRSEVSRRNASVSAPPGYRLTDFDQTHILTAVGSYRLPYGFEVGARFRYVTGRPTTPLVHDHDDYQADANRYRATRGPVNSTRLAPFHQLDLRVDKNFLFESWTLGAYLDVQNVYNAKNVETTFTDYRYRQEYDVPGIPILPVIGVKGSF